MEFPPISFFWGETSRSSFEILLLSLFRKEKEKFAWRFNCLESSLAEPPSLRESAFDAFTEARQTANKTLTFKLQLWKGESHWGPHAIKMQVAGKKDRFSEVDYWKERES